MRRPSVFHHGNRFPTTELPRCLRRGKPRPPIRSLLGATAAALALGCTHPAVRVGAEWKAPARPPFTQGNELFETAGAAGLGRTAPDSAAAVPHLKVLTFNTWTLELPVPRFLIEESKDVDIRMRLLPEKVRETGADILVLQEVWREERKMELIERFRRIGYPYSIHSGPDAGPLERGAFGNGLLIISRYPLSPQPRLLRFSKFTRGVEYFARKGAIKTSVDVPGLGWIDLVDAHLGAIATEKADGRADHFNGHNLSVLSHQVRELVQFITRTASSRIVLAAMDMNTHYQTLAHGAYQQAFAPEYSMLTCEGVVPGERGAVEGCLGLVDTFRRIHGFEQEPAWTYDTRSNRYAGSGNFADEAPGVLDYIFVNDNPRLVPVSAEVVLKARPCEADRAAAGLGARARLPLQVSDHYGVLTTFEIRG